MDLFQFKLMTMKNRFLVLLTITALFTIAHTSSFAQTRVGGAFAYGNDFDFGIQINSEFFVADNIAVAPDFTFFFPSNFDGWILNINGHYYFMEPNTGVYGLAGIGIENASFDSFGFSFSETNVGLNLGGGYAVDLGGNITPFGQLMLVIGNFNDVVFSGGARFTIGG